MNGGLKILMFIHTPHLLESGGSDLGVVPPEGETQDKHVCTRPAPPTQRETNIQKERKENHLELSKKIDC